MRRARVALSLAAVACSHTGPVLLAGPPDRPAVSQPAIAPALRPEPTPARASSGGEPTCVTPTPVDPLALPPLEPSTEPSLANLRAWVELLASAELRGRRAGTPDAHRAARLIADALRSFGTTPAGASGYCLPFTNAEGDDVNVVAHLGPEDASCVVILGAHYDALGTSARGVLYPGADDDATGIAVLLEVARLHRSGPPRLVLAAFGAEEPGLLGSAAYAHAPSVPLDRVAVMINVDMVGGRPGGNRGFGFEATGRARKTTAGWARAAAREVDAGLIAMVLGDRGDNASFSRHAPALFFTTTVSEHYHRPSDTAAHVDFDQVLHATRLVRALLAQVRCDQSIE